MSMGIWLVRPEAAAVATRLAALTGGELLGALPGAPEKSGAKSAFQSIFYSRKQWILLMATGIATRYLSGMPENKYTDPGVVVVDEALRFAIPVLGGHEAGANTLAYTIARGTGAIPVLTTATEALKPAVLGIGCRKGVCPETIHRAVTRALEATPFSIPLIREAATIDRKASEPGLLAWLERNGIPLRIFSTDQIRERPLTGTPSPWVRRQLGVAGVCEPCALLASIRGALVVPKTSLQGVSVAIVADAPLAAPPLLP